MIVNHKTRNRGIMLIVLLSFLVSCKQPSKESMQLLIAEKNLKEDYEKGVRMICQISESTFSEEDFYKYHNNQCIANVYFYKTHYYLRSGKLKDAQKSFLHFIKYLNSNETHYGNYNEDSLINNEQLVLKTLMNSEHSDDSTIQALKKQLAYFKPQEDFHNSKEENTTEYRILSYKLYSYSIILVFFSILVVQLFRKRESKYTNTLNHYKSKERQLNDHINQLTSQTANNEVEIGQLILQIHQMQSANSMHLGKGKEIYENLKAGGSMKNISIEDEQCFIDYYAFCHPQDFHKLISQYVSITLRHTTFLILSEMGYNDKEISNILFVKDSTIRNYKMRINKKQLTP